LIKQVRSGADLDHPRPHIAFLLPNMAGGGAERVAITLMQGFAGRGYQVSLVLMSADGPLLREVPGGVSVTDLSAPRLRSALKPLTRFLRAKRPDVLLSFMWPLNSVAIFAGVASGTGVRVAATEHAALSQQYAGWGRWHRLFMSATIRATYPRAHAVVCVSAGAADDLASLGALPRGTLTVIHNPVPGPAKKVKVPAAIERLWRGPGHRILSVGTLKDQKNHALLLRAFARLPANLPAQLMILGEGPLRAPLEQLANELGIADRLSVPGFSAEPWPYYASADLFVLSSDYEGFGNVLVEAMHMGLGTISTNCPSGPDEIINDERLGTLVPVGDDTALANAIEQLIAHPVDPALARARAADFSSQAALSAYEKVLFG
jgi:glycosyltransferase involved in cell wall biosynthesis